MRVENLSSRERLLDLFPANVLSARNGSPGGLKGAAVSGLAQGFGVDEAQAFVAEHFGFLHQHVHVFEQGPRNDPAEVLGTEAGHHRWQGEDHHVFIRELTYDLVVEGPLEAMTLTLPWPLKLVRGQGHVRLHSTIMARSPATLIDRPVVKAVKTPREKDLVGALRAIGIGDPLDLNRGIKRLWFDDVFDAPAVQYKRERATTRDVMDEEFLVKADDPELYDELQDKSLYDVMFKMREPECVKYFVADPTRGTLSFRRFPASETCIDALIQRIIAAN